MRTAVYLWLAMVAVGAGIVGLLKITGLSDWWIRANTWFYAKPVLEQMLWTACLATVLYFPLVVLTWRAQRENKAKQDAIFRWGKDSQTGEPIKSISEILRESESAKKGG